MIKRIGILTGGGDVPGLNPCIKAIVSRAEEENLQVVGIRRGWGGLVDCQLDDRESLARYTIELSNAQVRTIDRTGGTWLHTSRTNPANMPKDDLPAHLVNSAVPAKKEGRLDVTSHVLRVIDQLKLDLLISIGGDDTQSYSVRLHKEGFPVIAIPKTMDNDVYGTDYCIGFGTAISRGVHFFNQLRTSAGSHERIAVVELFGRDCGETSLITAYLASADRALIPEVPFDPQRLAELIMADKRNNPSNYAMIAVSEGASMREGSVVQYGKEDAFGHQKLGGIGAHTGDAIKELTGEGIIYQQVAYLMRSGQPDSIDLMVALNYAHMAIDLIGQGLFNRLVALRNGVYTNVPIDTVLESTKRVDVDALYDVKQYRPKLRHMDGKPMFLY